MAPGRGWRSWHGIRWFGFRTPFGVPQGVPPPPRWTSCFVKGSTPVYQVLWRLSNGPGMFTGQTISALISSISIAADAILGRALECRRRRTMVTRTTPVWAGLENPSMHGRSRQMPNPPCRSWSTHGAVRAPVTRIGNVLPTCPCSCEDARIGRRFRHPAQPGRRQGAQVLCRSNIFTAGSPNFQ